MKEIKYLNKYTMFIDWKSQHTKNVTSPQISVQV